MKGSKVRIIIWSAVGAVVLALLVVLLLKPSLLGRINLRLPNFTGVVYYDNDERYTAGAAEVENVRQIEVDWVSGSVEIIPYDGQTVLLEETASAELEASQQLHWLLDGDTLKIHFAKSGARGLDTVEKHLTIQVPGTLALTELSVETVSADVTVTGCTAQELSVDTTSGDLHIQDAGGEELDLDTVSGNMTGEELTFSKVDGESVSGEMALAFQYGFCPREAEFDSVSGNVTLTLPENSGFTAEFDSVSGDFSSELACTQAKGVYICGDGSARLSVNTTSGNMQVLIQK
ncbi:MAG: DUF4097 family beta strand repeat-containing protein [Faecousia sp.]